jgi:hypothetical protein
MGQESERQSLHTWLDQAVKIWERTSDPASYAMQIRCSVRVRIVQEIKKRTCDAPDIDRPTAAYLISDIEEINKHAHRFVDTFGSEFFVSAIGIPFAYAVAACYGRASRLIPAPVDPTPEPILME